MLGVAMEAGEWEGARQPRLALALHVPKCVKGLPPNLDQPRRAVTPAILLKKESESLRRWSRAEKKEAVDAVSQLACEDAS